jgi:RNA polymerase sporulation-specific sigma factor
MIGFGTNGQQRDPAEGDFGSSPELISAARSGDSEAFAQLFRSHRPRIFALTRRYFAPGWERDDLIQEATIGFFKAVRDFKGDRGSFASFVDLCVRRQVITFIKTATRQKHAALNYAISMDTPIFEDSDETLFNRLGAGDQPDLEEASEAHAFLSTLWARCSSLERGVLSLYSKGYSFVEMGLELGVHWKSIDNAIWRVKVKARKLLDERRFSGLPIRMPTERTPQSA